MTTTSLFTSKLQAFNQLSDWLTNLFKDQKLVGDADANQLVGGFGKDFIVGNGGNDVLRGSWGDDFILGNTGDDHLFGGLGHDVLHAGEGNDYIDGGWGNDLLSGDRGSDTLCGGRGCDTFEFNVRPEFFGNGTDVVLDFTLGVDKIAIRNGDVSKVTFVDAGSDVAVFYESWQIATLKNVGHVPADTSIFFNP